MKTNDTSIIIGISGPSGSGKSWLTRKLLSLLDGRIITLSQDSFYKSQRHMSMEERLRVNYDHPDAVDRTLLASQLEQLESGHSVECPVYDYATHDRTDDVEIVGPADYILLDGILLYAIPEVEQLIDFKIYVDTAPDICFIRRLERDVKERGRTMESVVRQYLDTVRPMVTQFILPSRDKADLVVNGETINETEILQIAEQLKQIHNNG